MHGTGLGNYAYGLWTVVAFNILMVLFFAISFIRPKKKIEWTSMGAFIGFVVALFTEMYGFPLTIYFLMTWMGGSYPALNPFTHSSGHLALVFLGLEESAIAMTLLHIISNLIIFFGFYLLYKGWMLIYQSEGERLVIESVYSYVRHPQYVGLFLITIGFLLQWPSLIIVVIWPILMFAYYRLAIKEEKSIEMQFGEEFIDYKKNVPAFFPRIVLKGGLENEKL